jgi:hypothetical protein
MIVLNKDVFKTPNTGTPCRKKDLCMSVMQYEKTKFTIPHLKAKFNIKILCLNILFLGLTRFNVTGVFAIAVFSCLSCSL